MPITRESLWFHEMRGKTLARLKIIVALINDVELDVGILLGLTSYGLSNEEFVDIIEKIEATRS